MARFVLIYIQNRVVCHSVIRDIFDVRIPGLEVRILRLIHVSKNAAISHGYPWPLRDLMKHHSKDGLNHTRLYPLVIQTQMQLRMQTHSSGPVEDHKIEPMLDEYCSQLVHHYGCIEEGSGPSWSGQVARSSNSCGGSY